MSKKKQQIDIVINLLAKWSRTIEFNNMIEYYDINKTAEGLITQLMNLTFGLKLSNLNNDKVNHPGIDLGDKENKIAFQVTSRKDAEKIRENLKTFVEKKYNDIYTNGIKFLILTAENKSISFGKNPPNKIYPQFNKDTDIIIFKDIIKKIDSLYDEDYNRFEAIKSVLEREIGKDTISAKVNTEELPLFSFSFQHPNFMELEKEEVAILLQDISRNYEQDGNIEFDIFIKEEDEINSKLEELNKDLENIKNRQQISHLKDIVLHLNKIKKEIRFKVSSVVLLKINEGYSNYSFTPFAELVCNLLSQLWGTYMIHEKTMITDIFDCKVKDRRNPKGMKIDVMTRSHNITFSIYESEEKIKELYKSHTSSYKVGSNFDPITFHVLGLEVFDLGTETIISKVFLAFIEELFFEKPDVNLEERFGIASFHIGIG